MLVCNFLHDCQPQTGTLHLGRDIGLKGAFENLVRETAPAIQHAQTDAPSRPQVLGAQHDTAIFGARHLARLTGVLRILKQVVNNLAQLPEQGIDLKEYLNDLEVDLIRQALNECDGVVAHAAKRLNMRRTTLVEKLRKYDLQR